MRGEVPRAGDSPGVSHIGPREAPLEGRNETGRPEGRPVRNCDSDCDYQTPPALQPPLFGTVQARTEAPPPAFVMVKFVPDFEYAVMR
jgi:hypothetical protein